MNINDLFNPLTDIFRDKYFLIKEKMLSVNGFSFVIDHSNITPKYTLPNLEVPTSITISYSHYNQNRWVIGFPTDINALSVIQKNDLPIMIRKTDIFLYDYKYISKLLINGRDFSYLIENDINFLLEITITQNMDDWMFFEKILTNKENLIITMFYNNKIISDNNLIEFERKIFNHNTTDLIKMLQMDVQKTYNDFIHNIKRQKEKFPNQSNLLSNMLTYGRSDSSFNPTGLGKYKILYNTYVYPVISSYLKTKDDKQLEEDFELLYKTSLQNDIDIKYFIKDNNFGDIVELIEFITNQDQIDSMFEKLQLSYVELKKLNNY